VFIGVEGGRAFPRARGQGMVEFAIGLVFMLILLAGIIDLGRAFFIYLELREAGQEGAAFGSIARDYGEPVSNVVARIEERVRESSDSPLDLQSDPNVQIEVYLLDHTGSGDWCAENRVEVKVVYDFRIATPFLGAILGGQSFDLQAGVQDTILRPPCP